MKYSGQDETKPSINSRRDSGNVDKYSSQYDHKRPKSTMKGHSTVTKKLNSFGARHSFNEHRKAGAVTSVYNNDLETRETNSYIPIDKHSAPRSSHYIDHGLSLRNGNKRPHSSSKGKSFGPDEIDTARRNLESIHQLTVKTKASPRLSALQVYYQGIIEGGVKNEVCKRALDAYNLKGTRSLLTTSNIPRWADEFESHLNHLTYLTGLQSSKYDHGIQKELDILIEYYQGCLVRPLKQSTSQREVVRRYEDGESFLSLSGNNIKEDHSGSDAKDGYGKDDTINGESITFQQFEQSKNAQDKNSDKMQESNYKDSTDSKPGPKYDRTSEVNIDCIKDNTLEVHSSWIKKNEIRSLLGYFRKLIESSVVDTPYQISKAHTYITYFTHLGSGKVENDELVKYSYLVFQEKARGYGISDSLVKSDGFGESLSAWVNEFRPVQVSLINLEQGQKLLQKLNQIETVTLYQNAISKTLETYYTSLANHKTIIESYSAAISIFVETLDVKKVRLPCIPTFETIERWINRFEEDGSLNQMKNDPIKPFDIS